MHQVSLSTQTLEQQALPSDIHSQVVATCAVVDALDTEIAELQQRTAQLPAILSALARHPVLWLLLGREGVDRPGTLETIVGQQVVTVTRRDHTAMALVGVVMLIMGVLIGAGIVLILVGGA
jgi:hypothetical protein